ncbi:hypothetical protein [Salmonella enterica]|uniref:hypothetical protein n=1 Tax=Salmonella enterica TaxID=28901 RepID=UPI0009B00714|nr:hypothetical protein [Salmonella enterica]MCE6966789.1 hypothetical protein [Enterobacter sp. MW07]UTL05125.1 hypothetical protein NL707_22755 [Salmonella enterica subsp. enterica serovar Montevideo]
MIGTVNDIAIALLENARGSDEQIVCAVWRKEDIRHVTGEGALNEEEIRTVLERLDAELEPDQQFSRKHHKDNHNQNPNNEKEQGTGPLRLLTRCAVQSSSPTPPGGCVAPASLRRIPSGFGLR